MSRPAWIEETEAAERRQEATAAAAAKAVADSQRAEWRKVIDEQKLVYHVGECIRTANGWTPSIAQAAHLVCEGDLDREGEKYLVSLCANGGWQAAVEAVDKAREDRLAARTAEILAWINANNPPELIKADILRRNDLPTAETAEGIVSACVAEYNLNIPWRKTFRHTRKEVADFLNKAFNTRSFSLHSRAPEMGMRVGDGYSSGELWLDESGALCLRKGETYVDESKYKAWRA